MLTKSQKKKTERKAKNRMARLVRETAMLGRWDAARADGEKAGWIGYFDGACEPTNPGNMGIGAILLHDGKTISTVSKATGWGTNNIAEYDALIALLELAVEKNATNLVICGDSQLVIRQMEGGWRVKNEGLVPRYQEAQTLVATLPGVRFAWIRRELNGLADDLSKAQMN